MVEHILLFFSFSWGDGGGGGGGVLGVAEPHVRKSKYFCVYTIYKFLNPLEKGTFSVVEKVVKEYKMRHFTNFYSC